MEWRANMQESCIFNVEKLSLHLTSLTLHFIKMSKNCLEKNDKKVSKSENPLKVANLGVLSLHFTSLTLHFTSFLVRVLGSLSLHFTSLLLRSEVRGVKIKPLTQISWRSTNGK